MSKDTRQPDGAGTVMMPARSVPPDSYQPRPSNTIPSEPRELIVGGAASPSSILIELRKPPTERLEIEARAASGGMGTIDVAVDRALDRRIAIKTLHPHLRGDDAAVRMFLREARLTGLLDHPHIVPVYDVGERDEDALYFSMKLVEGQTLAAVIGSLPRGPLDTVTLYALLDVVTKVCDALAFAHSRGVIHCDVKPANVMVGDFGQVYLMDWGIARLVATESSPGSVAALAERASVIGTPSYMSPEQARGDRVGLDARSDVFLLGALLYEILTRRAPYSTRDRTETLALAAACAFPSPRKVAGDLAVAPELERIVMRAMAKHPDDRYPSVSALREDLVRFMRGGAEYPRVSFPAGAVIVREGEKGDAAYIVVSGKCEVHKRLPSGTQKLQVIGPGDVFGETAILSEGPRTASVVALEETEVLVVTSAVLQQEMAALKPWIATVMKSLAKRFRDVDTAHRAAVTAPSPARVANQVLMHVTTWGTMPWSALARALEAQVGWPPAIVLAAIAPYGITVDVEDDRITIADPTALAARLRTELA